MKENGNNGNFSKIYKNGITSTGKFYEADGVLLNNFSGGSYTPVANTENSCLNMGNMDFSNYRVSGEDLILHVECDLA
jgi:hypothetical protein